MHALLLLSNLPSTSSVSWRYSLLCFSAHARRSVTMAQKHGKKEHKLGHKHLQGDAIGKPQPPLPVQQPHPQDGRGREDNPTSVSASAGGSGLDGSTPVWKGKGGGVNLVTPVHEHKAA